jgi:hypothetical protein
LKNKNPAAPSVFQPAALLREARRQKKLPTVDVPGICILDPDVTSSVACDRTDERGHSTIAVSSGTTGLHLCTSAAGVGAGDEVIARGDGQPPPRRTRGGMNRNLHRYRLLRAGAPVCATFSAAFLSMASASAFEQNSLFSRGRQKQL